MPSGNLSLLTLTVSAAAALAACRFVTQAGAYPAAGGTAFGVTRSIATAAGELVPVDVMGTAIAEAGAAFARDAALQVDASGRVVPLVVGSGAPVARAMEAASVVGAMVEILLVVAAGVISSGTAVPVAPGAVTNVQPGTPTANSQPLTWSAPSSGDAPITYQVAYRLGSSTGAYTNFGSPVSGTSATVTGLASNTAYDYQITPINSVAPGTPGLLNDAVTAAGSGVDTSPRMFYAPANATGDAAVFDAPFAAATKLTGSASGGRSGTFTTVADSTKYVWVAVLHSAAPTGIHMSDGVGFGGFSGANSTGLFTGSDVDPIVTYKQYTDPNGGAVYDCYRSNGKAATTSTNILS